IENNENYLTVQLFFANSGTVQSITSRDEIIKLDGVYNMNYNYKENDFIKPIENASVRAGYVIITGNTNQNIQKKVDNLYKKMLMHNKQRNNLIINGDYYKRYTE
ncbi:hypothetical protein, partial [Vallitalea guaymasensis]|uniref:hypothetical protein n=1 Tax=Vallitalea guaymasensis TaxID=1185412 RepID=UPI002F3F1EFE